MNNSNIHYILGESMKPAKEYDRQELKRIVKTCSSLRGMGKILGITNPTMKRVLLRSDIDYSHFKHGKAYDGLIGNTYHMLTVLKITQKGRKKFAECLCDCGKNKTIRVDDIKSGRAISCGCHSKNRWNMVGDKNPYFKGVGELRQTKYSEIKRQALKRDKEFNVSIEYLWEMYEEQDRKCSLTNLPIIFGRNGYRNETSASLDRIDNSKGYIEGNVRWVLKDINMIRGSYDTDYFIKLCCAVAESNSTGKFPDKEKNAFMGKDNTETGDK